MIKHESNGKIQSLTCSRLHIFMEIIIMDISVIIPAFNHEKFIALSIKSVLKQSYGAFELIIINDGSTDRTEKEILQFKDPRIRYLTQENHGAHYTLNKGIAIAQGKYISILNSDDEYSPDRLMQCFDFIKQYPDVTAVLTWVEGINSDGKSVSDMPTPHTIAWQDWYTDALKLYENNDFLICTFAKNIAVTTSNFFIKKSAFDVTGQFNKLRYAHDWDMLLRISRNFKVGLLKKRLLRYRIHESNTVLEAGSAAKVQLEVNWLIAHHLKQLQPTENLIDLMCLLRKNHYVNMEMIITLLFLDEYFPDDKNPMTARLLEFLRQSGHSR